MANYQLLFSLPSCFVAVFLVGAALPPSGGKWKNLCAVINAKIGKKRLQSRRVQLLFSWWSWMHKSPDCLYIAGIHRLCVQAWIKGFHGWQKSKQQLYPARFRWCWVSNMLIACVKLCMQMPANIKIVVFLSSNMTETLASTWCRTLHLCFVFVFYQQRLDLCL